MEAILIYWHKKETNLRNLICMVLGNWSGLQTHWISTRIMRLAFLRRPKLSVDYLVHMISQRTNFSLKKPEILQIGCCLPGIHLLGYPTTLLTWHMEMPITLDGLE
uniref:Uncharacterized protein n=1 Tax=Vitis vinifera TaxID=29760 RepID=F6GYP3_VITVI